MKLAEMTYSELEEHRKELETAMKAIEKAQRADAKKAINQVAKDYGYTVEELFNTSRRKGLRSAPSPKYRNPENPEQTWTGRGRRPQWFVDAIDKGLDLRNLEI